MKMLCASGSTLFTILGLLFPIAVSSAPLKSDETVLFLSGIGYQKANGWLLQIRGWTFESEYHKPLTSLFRKAIGIRDDEMTSAEQVTFRERAQFFLVDNERKKSVVIKLGDMNFTLSSSAPNGHFETNLHILFEDVERFGLVSLLSNRVAQFQMIPPKARQGYGAPKGVIQILPPTGVSVISDIDDTIKISSVRDRKELLRNTFCRPYQPVLGMADLYQQWEKQGARFHYLSASPWQLYQPLSEFIRTNGFPDGTFQLKTFRLKDQTAFDLFKSPESFKRTEIEPLLKEFPHRRFILVGDSGEKDPEIYGALARKFENQIARILIRDTTGEAHDSRRYRSAFAGIDTNLWRVFSAPAEINADLLP